MNLSIRLAVMLRKRGGKRERATHVETRGVHRTTYGEHDVPHTLRVRCLTSSEANIGPLVMNKGEMGGPPTPLYFIPVTLKEGGEDRKSLASYMPGTEMQVLNA